MEHYDKYSRDCLAAWGADHKGAREIGLDYSVEIAKKRYEAADKRHLEIK